MLGAVNCRLKPKETKDSSQRLLHNDGLLSSYRRARVKKRPGGGGVAGSLQILTSLLDSSPALKKGRILWPESPKGRSEREISPPVRKRKKESGLMLSSWT